MLVFDLVLTPQGIGAGAESAQLNDMQGNYQTEGEYQQQAEQEENGIIGEAVSEHVTEEVISQEYVGDFELTAYTWTGSPCADGEYPRASHTVACNDPALWHEWIYIEGIGTYYVHDTGGMSSNVIDIYMDDYDSCINFGRQYAKVYIVR